MEVEILEVNSKKKKAALISKSTLNELPKIKDGWSFNWKKLFKIEGGEIYKLTLKTENPGVEGVMMLTIMYDEMVFMNNIEIAPHNIGSGGNYDNVAGCLIAFGCLMGLEWGRGNYYGFLTFDSKTELIPLYHEKYLADFAMGKRMFITPDNGLKLIKKYLNLDL